jgi:hypothetical protein
VTLPRLAAWRGSHALRRPTNWTPERLLVSGADLETLMHSYGAMAPAPRGSVGFVDASTLGAAAAHLTAATANARTIWLTAAHSDTASWVRPESLAGVDALFMRHDEEKQECLAATTLH